MKQQTAVEWLNQMLILNGIFFDYKLLEQSKQMEKDQIIDGYGFGYTNGFHDAEQAIPIKIDDAKQYYNETYNK